MSELKIDLSGIPKTVPLIVDLDGTLTPSDTLYEGVLDLARTRLSALWRLPVWLVQGRQVLKSRLADVVPVSPNALPWREDLIEWIRSERDGGRTVALVSAADGRVTDAVSEHLQCFDLAIGSSVDVNLKGERKLERIRRELGAEFIYMGDSRADLPIWNSSRFAITVDAPTHVLRRISAPAMQELRFRNGTWLQLWIKACRVHQWLKNSLLFLAFLLAPHLWSVSILADLTLAFLAFGLTASATYILNDLWDVKRDRSHPNKRNRPFASGAVSIKDGLIGSCVLLLAGLAVGAFLGVKFFLMLVGYVFLTLSYTWHLKQYVLVDVMTLALLYTWRVLAGAVVSGALLSTWLLAFSVFIFTSLALVKRQAELFLLEQSGRTAASGRDYRVSDLAVLLPFGIACSVGSVLILCLYVGSEEISARYATSELLWLVALVLLYWLGRMWIKTTRGEMHDDPIVFSFRDRGSLVATAVMVALTLTALLVEVPL